jgi:hypothetical protein
LECSLQALRNGACRIFRGAAAGQCLHSERKPALNRIREPLGIHAGNQTVPIPASAFNRLNAACATCEMARIENAALSSSATERPRPPPAGELQPAPRCQHSELAPLPTRRLSAVVEPEPSSGQMLHTLLTISEQSVQHFRPWERFLGWVSWKSVLRSRRHEDGGRKSPRLGAGECTELFAPSTVDTRVKTRCRHGEDSVTSVS